MTEPTPIKLPELVMTDKEKAQRQALKRAVRPKLAATIVLLHGDKILMGQRASRSDFMPSVYVFPGGRVDRADSYAPYLGDLAPREETILEAAMTPRRARACVLAALRETYEETGLLLAEDAKWSKNINHPTWDIFRQKGVMANLSSIEVFGRAITPPHRHKRFDTWFFIKRLEGDLPAISDSVELLNVGWFTLDEIKDLKTHRATTMMLQVLENYLKAPSPAPDIFFSSLERGKFKMKRFP